MKQWFLLAAVCLSFLSCTEDQFPSYLALGSATESQNEDDGSTIIAEIDWTNKSGYYNDIWYSEWCTVSVNQGEGLVIESLPEEGANYWEPQVPMIGHIPEIKEGGLYVVKFTVIAPSAGEIRLDFCSWDGTGATKDWVGPLEEGEKEYTVEFYGYPTTCTDAMIFYQSGHMPGRHVIRNVQVIDLNKDHIYSVIGTLVGGWDNDVDMVLGSGGLYFYRFENVAAGSYEFKIRQDHSWDVNWGSDFKHDGPNCKVEVANDGSTIIVTFNNQTGEIAWKVVG